MPIDLAYELSERPRRRNDLLQRQPLRFLHEPRDRQRREPHRQVRLDRITRAKKDRLRPKVSFALELMVGDSVHLYPLQVRQSKEIAIIQ